MKKLLISISLLFFISLSAQAKTIKVISLDAFSTLNPSDTYKVQVVEKEEFKDGTIYEAGTIISGKVIKVEHAKRGKRDGYFEFVPTDLTLEGQTWTVTDSKYTAQVVGLLQINTITDTKTVVKNVAKGVTGLIFKGASQGISFVEGVAEAEKGQKIKSGFVKVYKDSPLVYIEEGSELKINPDDLILLKFKKTKTKN